MWEKLKTKLAREKKTLIIASKAFNCCPIDLVLESFVSEVRGVWSGETREPGTGAVVILPALLPAAPPLPPPHLLSPLSSLLSMRHI